MSYDVAVWEGPRPASDDEAGEVFDQLMDEAEESDTEPAPAIAAFVDELMAQVPDAEDGPWAGSPLDDAAGPIVCLTMSFGGAEDVISTIAELARARGLVCYDPQQGALL